MRSAISASARTLAALAIALVAPAAFAQDHPSTTGQTGLVNMPDARFAPVGSWRTGLSWMRPYETLWSGVTLFPWLEPSFRYTRIFHVPGFPESPGVHYGDYKDKSLDVKLRLLDEREFWPQIALGAQDVFGTDIFRAYYAVASKRFGDFDATLGYGRERIDGAFGGLRYTPQALPDWSVVAEYDANDYARDHGSDLSGAASYKKGPAVALEYRRKWYGVSLGAAHGEPVVNAFVNVPLDEKEWVPKVDEPPPYTRINPRPTGAQWREDPAHRERLQRALYEQDFRNVKLAYDNEVLSAELTNIRISSMPRAVGRAARTLLSFAPLETREIKVTYTLDRLPLATYDFINVPLLQRYFNGMASRKMLAEYVAIQYAAPEKRDAAADREETLAAFEEPIPEHLLVQTGVEGNYFSLRAENFLGGKFFLQPGVEGYFNDPSGAFKLDVSAIASTEHWLAPHTQVLSDWKLTLWENVSDVTQPSNSELPHVRSDVADYKRGGKFKILRLVANQYFQPARQWYARVSAGIYEEMYDGVGGQVLYLPPKGDWAGDVAVDWVKQRDFEGFFGTRDYDTVTAIASLNYRLAEGVTLTGRAGRFLAKDEGVRFEAKRRFASGVEVGAWYTYTNGNDITSPGSPSSPYHDKGIMMSIPLSPMLTRDTSAVGGFALAPWTRDVGQMVVSPGDLYRLTERSVVQMHEQDGLSNLGDRPDDYDLPSLGTGARDRRWPDFLGDDALALAPAAGKINWWQTALGGAALTLAAGSVDRRAADWAERHKDSAWLKDFVRFGDALPLVALGASGMFAFDSSRPRLSDAGVAALEAGAAGLVAAEVLKYGVGRARPSAGLGTTEFSPGSREDSYHSFPSNHTVAMWAAITPYAREYDMPWLYGVAALTNFARIGSREHWVSDTVGGAAIGYVLGYLAWDTRREARQRNSAPQVLVSPTSVNLAWKLD